MQTISSMICALLVSRVLMVGSCFTCCLFAHLAFPSPWNILTALCAVAYYIASQTTLAPYMARTGDNDINKVRAHDRLSFLPFLALATFLP